MRLHSHSSDRTPASVYGGAGESFAWKAVQDLYRLDRLDEAYREAVDLGAGTMGYGLGTFRLIEAEWHTRRRSQTRKVNGWLSLEFIPEAVQHASDLERVVVAAFEEAAGRLGLTQGAPTLVTILAEEANTPWSPGRHGFCTPKASFAKVCIPFDLLADPAELGAALRHEYAHVLSQDAAAGLCPRWLDEGIAMQVGGELSQDARRGFGNGSLAWLDPFHLDAAFGKDRESEDGRRIVSLAYQQSAWLGAYLVDVGSERSLGSLLAAHTSDPWTRLLTLFRNELPVDAALRRVCGFASAELFRRARSWLK